MSPSSVFELLQVSIRTWAVAATVRGPGGGDLVARVQPHAGPQIGIATVGAGDGTLPAWSFGALNRPRQDWIRSPSLLSLLVHLRRELDPGFRPCRIIIGYRGDPSRSGW